MMLDKKNRVKTLFCFCLLCVCTLAACSDNGMVDLQDVSLRGRSPQRFDYSAIQNPDNPCNDYGVLHNAGLDYVLTASGADRFEELDYARIKSASAEFVISISELLEPGDQAAVESMLDNVLVNLTAEDAYARLPLSPEQVGMCRLIHRAAVDEHVGSLEEMLAALDAVELDVINSTIPEHQKRLPLAVVAVAKHSAVYHADYLKLPPADVKQTPDDLLADDPKKNKKRFRQVVEADLVGAITGAIGGFVSGLIGGAIGGSLVGGPVGGIPGAASGALAASALGAVGGAIASSANAIIKPG